MYGIFGFGSYANNGTYLDWQKGVLFIEVFSFQGLLIRGGSLNIRGS